MPRAPTAALLVIGDELLSGRFTDENGPHLARRLSERGIALRRLCFLPDEPDEIAEAVTRLAPRVDQLFTSGGIGPTHDDRTYEGVALGLGLPLEERPELLRAIEARRGPPDPALRRMALVPRGARLLWGAFSYPVVQVRNVSVLPGVPRLFRAQLEAVLPTLPGGPPLHRLGLASSLPEHRYALALSRLAARHPRVSIGSYPREGEGEPRSLLLLASPDARALAACRDALLALLAELGDPGAREVEGEG